MLLAFIGLLIHTHTYIKGYWQVLVVANCSSRSLTIQIMLPTCAVLVSSQRVRKIAAAASHEVSSRGRGQPASKARGRMTSWLTAEDRRPIAPRVRSTLLMTMRDWPLAVAPHCCFTWCSHVPREEQSARYACASTAFAKLLRSFALYIYSPSLLTRVLFQCLLYILNHGTAYCGKDY